MMYSVTYWLLPFVYFGQFSVITLIGLVQVDCRYMSWLLSVSLCWALACEVCITSAHLLHVTNSVTASGVDHNMAHGTFTYTGRSEMQYRNQIFPLHHKTCYRS
jgi:hypothetical protein